MTACGWIGALFHVKSSVRLSQERLRRLRERHGGADVDADSGKDVHGALMSARREAEESNRQIAALVHEKQELASKISALSSRVCSVPHS
jgi:predicted  nucleic acid-binding Zn-ribbon protein